MKLNTATIPHYKCQTIPISELKKRIGINEDYLTEKPTWYEINRTLQYFKVRDDYRLFAEQFFSMFGKEIIGLDTLDYKIAIVRTHDIVKNREVVQTGLISENFQTDKKNYYLVSELMNSEITDLVSYGYSLEGLLNYFKILLDEQSYNRIKDFLIKLFVADAFTLQLDRNPNNIGFEINKINGIPYKKRLRPECIGQGASIITENGMSKITGLTPSKVFDNERILGIDHKKVFLHNEGDIWTPIFPYSSETFFKSQDEAIAVQRDFDGLDPNLACLCMNYPTESFDIIDRLANDDEYRRILENFDKPTSQLMLTDSTKEYFEKIFKERKNVMKRVLTLK